MAERQNIELDYTKVNPNDWNLACSKVCERRKTLRFEGQTWVQKEQIPIDKQPLKEIFANIASKKPTEIEQLQQQYIQAKATLSPKEQESLTVAERLIHHAFEKENISAHTQEYYLGNFYRNTTAEIQNGTFTIPNPYQKTPTISKKTDKGIDI